MNSLSIDNQNSETYFRVEGLKKITLFEVFIVGRPIVRTCTVTKYYFIKSREYINL
jgi:hypothetical protein